MSKEKSKCSESQDQAHCFHTASVNQNDTRIGTKQCCWCGKNRKFDDSNETPKKHGKYHIEY